MISRGAFLLIVAFWVAMNVLLWRTEYDSHSRGTPVPLDLVCRKIFTAPDPSSLSVYQDGQRMGFCEFSTSVEQQMAELDENQPPPEGIVARAGYQIRLSGNVAFGDFTNRVKFDGHVKFSPRREWRELDLKFFTRVVTVEIHSLATNQSVTVRITSDDETDSHVFTFADLQNPAKLLQAFGGDADGGWASGLALPSLPAVAGGLDQVIPWDARHVRLKVGRESVSAYRLESHMLGQTVVIYVSTLGEILRAELPGGVTAVLDEWGRT